MCPEEAEERCQRASSTGHQEHHPHITLQVTCLNSRGWKSPDETSKPNLLPQGCSTAVPASSDGLLSNLSLKPPVKMGFPHSITDTRENRKRRHLSRASCSVLPTTQIHSSFTYPPRLVPPFLPNLVFPIPEDLSGLPLHPL